MNILNDFHNFYDMKIQMGSILELTPCLLLAGSVIASDTFFLSFLFHSYWMEFQVKGVSLARALQCWERSLQESNKGPKVPPRSCPFHLIDSCPWPHCNPTCSALPGHPTGSEGSFMQTLVRLRLDVPSKAQELKS